MSALGRRRSATALAALVTLGVAAGGGTASAANGQTPFSKLPRLFFGATPTPVLAPSAVIARYERALAALRSPRFLAFSFSIEQVGAHILSQSHRVFRDGLNERDETIVVDGRGLPRPDVRIFRNRSYHYDLAAVAPRASDYAFTFAGTQQNGDHEDYLFDTAARGGRPFAVTTVVIDGQRFLPSDLGFHIASGALRGQGRLLYGGYDRYWLVREADVTARDAAGTSSRERIVWAAYQFPESLPASTFSSRVPVMAEPQTLAPPRAAAPSPREPATPAASGREAPPAQPASPTAAAPKPPAGAAHVAPATPARPRPKATASAPEPDGTPALLRGPVTPAPLRVETLPPAPATAAATPLGIETPRSPGVP